MSKGRDERDAVRRREVRRDEYCARPIPKPCNMMRGVLSAEVVLAGLGAGR